MGTNPSCPVRSIMARAYNCPCPMFHDGSGTHVGTTGTSSVSLSGLGSRRPQSSLALPATGRTDNVIPSIAGKTTRPPEAPVLLHMADCWAANPQASFSSASPLCPSAFAFSSSTVFSSSGSTKRSCVDIRHTSFLGGHGKVLTVFRCQSSFLLLLHFARFFFFFLTLHSYQATVFR
jgi:hypothetical protein